LPTGGNFDPLPDHPWNARRRELNHTEFGNTVLRVWVDEGRWIGLLASATNPQRWTPESRRVWDGSFTAWAEVRTAVLEHAARFDECAPSVTASYSQRVSWVVRRTHGRFTEWLTDVRAAVAAVDEAVAELAAARSRGQPAEVTAALPELATAGRRLKDTFSGRGYFNPAVGE
jgi:hypothetical protein